MVLPLEDLMSGKEGCLVAGEAVLCRFEGGLRALIYSKEGGKGGTPLYRGGRMNATNTPCSQPV
jgi:hypothetical protein